MTGDAASQGAQQLNGIQLAVNEINEAGGILGKNLEFDVYDDQLLTLIIHGFEVTTGGESKIILENNPIAVSWHSRTKGDMKYWTIDNGEMSGYAFLDSSHFCIELDTDRYQSFASLNNDIDFLDKNKERLDIDFNGSSAGSFGGSGNVGSVRWLVYLSKMVDINEVKYLQIGDEIIKCD